MRWLLVFNLLISARFARKHLRVGSKVAAFHCYLVWHGSTNLAAHPPQTLSIGRVILGPWHWLRLPKDTEDQRKHKRHIQLFISLHTRHRIDDNDTMPTCDILVGKALWMLRREHVYWFYCCNWHHQNVSGMQPQAIEHCAIPATLSLLKFYITCLFHKGGLQKTNPSY